MKILFYTFTGADYGLDTLYDGLCRNLGYENVIEYPEKPSLHGATINRYLQLPIFFDYPIVKRLKKDKFDIILVSTRAIIDDTLRKKSKKIPTFIIDQDDGANINLDLIKELNAKLYFKREYLTTKKYDPKIVPLSFSYSEKYIPNDINGDRTNFLFYAGRGYQDRWKYIEVLKELINKAKLPSIIEMVGGSERVYNQKEYSSLLINSKIGLNLRGYGFDSGRYYETPAHGALLFSFRFPIVIENEFSDGNNAAFFSNVDEMKSKFNYLIKHPRLVHDLSIKGHEHFMKYHTTKQRAKQMLDKIKDKF